MIRKIAIIYGLGGSIFDPAGGEAYLAQRCKAVGLTVGGPFDYADSQGVYNFLKTADFRSIAGDSFGACFGPQYARNLAPVKIEFLAGFQPSVYSTNIQTAPDGTKYIPIPSNVVTAHCIRDPDWIDTAGLGYATWIADDPNKTKLTVTQIRGAHPNDDGPTQDIIFNQLKSLIGA